MVTFRISTFLHRDLTGTFPLNRCRTRDFILQSVEGTGVDPCTRSRRVQKVTRYIHISQ